MLRRQGRFRSAQPSELLESMAVFGDGAAADAEGPGYFANVDIAATVDREAVPGTEHTRIAAVRTAPAGQHAAVGSQHADPTRGVDRGLALSLGDLADSSPELRHVDDAVRPNLELRRPERIEPLVEVVALR